MINIAHGNLLTADVEALVNTVNTEGVMGKGIALQFKRAYPKVYDLYRDACKRGDVQIGKMHIVFLGALADGPQWIINFPTKKHWKAKSRLVDIEAGLADLVVQIKAHKIRSIALPPLGCGHGGLKWEDVFPLIASAMSDLPDTLVQVFAPEGAPNAQEMPNRTAKPKMTHGAATLLALVNRYQKALLDPQIRLLEVHKLMYFLQEAGEPLRLNYTADSYGPYASNLRHVLSRAEGHWISGFGDGEDNPRKQLELINDAASEATTFLQGQQSTEERMERVSQLIDGFEDPYGLELLGSVHWVMTHVRAAADSSEVTVKHVHEWNARKASTIKPDHIEKAWRRLKDYKWDTEARSAVHS